MLELFFLLNRRYQIEIVDKIFDLIRIHLILSSVHTKSTNSELDMRLLHITKKLLKQIIADDYIIKMNKNVVHLIDRFNSIQKKRTESRQEAASDTFDDLVRISTEDDEEECA